MLRAFYDRKRREGKDQEGSLRALKRRLATVVYRRMLDDARKAARPAGQQGTALISSAAGSHPTTRSLEVTHRTHQQPT